MEIPENILSIINRINQSEENWKALFMGMWGFAYEIKKYENTPYWNKKIMFGLPASKNKNYIYTPNKLYSLLISKDMEITLDYLITLFSLFEELLNEASEILLSRRLNTGYWRHMKTFFEEDCTEDILTNTQIKELRLAKVTRNKHIHNGSKINQEWIDSYEDVRGNSIASIGDNLSEGFPNLFHQIEEWQDLIVNISNSIKDKIILI